MSDESVREDAGTVIDGPIQDAVIDCPRCLVPMERVTFEEIVVDRCPKCLGIWFDMLEQEDLKKRKGSERIDSGSKSATPSEEFHPLACPRCKAPMYIARDPQQTHIVYEKCVICYGVFFDAGEFTDFKNTTFSEYLRGLFS